MGAWKNVKENKGKWITAVLLIIAIKIFTSDKLWIEEFYSTGVYISISKILRIFFGRIPFSFGDILYFLAGCWIVWKITKNVRLLIKRKLTGKLLFQKMLNIILILAFIYIIFYLFWGMNYDRKGIAYQFN